MTATFAQIPIQPGLYNSVAQRLPIIDALAISSNMGTPGNHHIMVNSEGYYRVVANLQITGVIGSQAVLYFEQNTTIINQYFLDVTGNMIVSFETVMNCNHNDTITLYLTVSTNGAVLINPANSPYYPSALSAYLID